MGDLTIAEWAQLVTMLGVFFMIARGIVTKKDCKDCRSETDKDFDSGRKEFKEIKSTQADHGEQLAGIGGTVNAMEQNVQLLVGHHIGGGSN